MLLRCAASGSSRVGPPMRVLQNLRLGNTTPATETRQLHSRNSWQFLAQGTGRCNHSSRWPTRHDPILPQWREHRSHTFATHASDESTANVTSGNTKYTSNRGSNGSSTVEPEEDALAKAYQYLASIALARESPTMQLCREETQNTNRAARMQVPPEQVSLALTPASRNQLNLYNVLTGPIFISTDRAIGCEECT